MITTTYMPAAQRDDIFSAIDRGAGYGADPDAVSALCGTVTHDWGCYGYRVRIAGLLEGGAYALVSSSDGGRFLLHSDRWGNVTQVEPHACCAPDMCGTCNPVTTATQVTMSAFPLGNAGV